MGIYLTEYIKDCARWTGPEIEANSLDEAEAIAARIAQAEKSVDGNFDSLKVLGVKIAMIPLDSTAGGMITLFCPHCNHRWLVTTEWLLATSLSAKECPSCKKFIDPSCTKPLDPQTLSDGMPQHIQAEIGRAVEAQIPHLPANLLAEWYEPVMLEQRWFIEASRHIYIPHPEYWRDRIHQQH